MSIILVHFNYNYLFKKPNTENYANELRFLLHENVSYQYIISIYLNIIKQVVVKILIIMIISLS